MGRKSEKNKIAHPHSGEEILEQLRRFGSDVNRKHEMTFWLYYPSEDLASRAAVKAKSSGLHPEIAPPIENSPHDSWLCLLYCPHVPDELILDGVIEFCEQLAEEFSGTYDGWEARLELPDGADPDIPPFENT
ncbi:MAG: ribonuclease E inhibitor RraB [Candidatus Marinimicrobia bacterium]|nr:ribonuclease E inhibitor RraB [Candidatus Neomarinimicrobiota bacterium]MCF7829278.1 ribonuclease E inhibitor RraB [Candidatus Neomarinimicrobiota bacterium]MCF7881069.1 ribonuclease E inhibitor RraB [Candidatus Neomarinimicrobiota bacterium]